MAPKASAAPKRSVDDVNREYAEKQAAWEQRKQTLQQSLQAAKNTADAARLELVAARESKVYFESRVVAEREQNDSFERFTAEQFVEWNKKLRTSKRKTKDGLFDVHYARDAASSMEKEVDQVQLALEELATDGQASECALEQEIDKLALNVAWQEAQRSSLQRTMSKLEFLDRRIGAVRIRRAPRMESALQLTVIGCGSATQNDLDSRSLTHPIEALLRAEQALVRTCGFDVVEKLIPDKLVVASLVRAILANRDHGGGLPQRWGQRVQNACIQASTGVLGASSFNEDTIDATRSLILLSCPVSLDHEGKLCLVISLVNEASRDLLQSLEPERFSSILASELLPLQDLLAVVMSTATRPFTSLLLDTWVDANSSANAFCLYWHRATMDSPLVYEYLPHRLAGLQQTHASFLHSSLSQQTRNLMLHALTTIVENSPNASTLDGAVVAQTLERALDSFTGDRSSKQTVTLLRRLRGVTAAIGTPFAPLFLSVRQLRDLYHTMPVRLRPKSLSTYGGLLRVEARSSKLVPTPLPSGYRWASRRITHHTRTMDPIPDEIEQAVNWRGGSWEGARENALLDVTAHVVARAPLITKSVDLLVEDGVYDTGDEYLLSNKRRPIAITEVGKKEVVSVVESDEARWASLFSRRLQCASAATNELLRNNLFGPPEFDTEQNCKSRWTIEAPFVSENHTSVVGTKWLQLDGLRPDVDHRLLLVEFCLTLDVDHAAEMKTAVLDSNVLKKIEATVCGWCETLDAERPQQHFVRVVHHVRSFTTSSPLQVQVHLEVGGLLTESATRAALRDAAVQEQNELNPHGAVRKEHMTMAIAGGMKVKGCLTDVLRYWMRSHFAEKSGRWARTASETLGVWRTCGDASSLAVRTTRLFHMLRDWRAQLCVENETEVSIHSQRSSLRRNVQILSHLMLVGGGMLGDLTLTPLVRLFDVRSRNEHKLLQLPQSFLNNFTESEIFQWLHKEEHVLPCTVNPTEILRSVVVDRVHLESCHFHETFEDRSRVVPSNKTTVVLCWLVPSSLRGIWHSCNSVDDRRGLAELPHQFEAIRRHFHRTVRVLPTGVGAETLVTVLCTNLWTDDETTLSADKLVEDWNRVAESESSDEPSASSNQLPESSEFNFQMKLHCPYTHILGDVSTLRRAAAFPLPLSFWNGLRLQTQNTVGLVALRFEGSHAPRFTLLPWNTTNNNLCGKIDALRQTTVEQFVASSVRDS